MTGWHVMVRGATQAEIDERGCGEEASALDGAAVVCTDAVPVLAICNEYGTCVWPADGREARQIEELVEAAMEVIA